MRIVVDTREQNPLRFTSGLVKEELRACLKVGDYGLLLKSGKLLPIVFERKSVPDLYGTLGKGYVRFKREMQKAESQGVKLIILVEGSLLKVLKGTKYSKRLPKSLVYQVFTIWARYGVQTVFCQNESEAAEFITQFFIAHRQEYEMEALKCQKR